MDDAPRSHAEVLEAEHRHLHGGDPPPGGCAHSALCFSGGGIRSATFALGVVQALAALKVLPRFDYLSTVSGGGFTGGWLAAWLHNAGPAGRHEVFRQLGGDPSLGAPGTPRPVARMRAASRYMSPEMGMVSADSWTLVATIVRNLFLNVTVLLPIIAAVLLIPHLYLAAIQGFWRQERENATLMVVDPSTIVLVASGLVTALAVGFIVLQLPSYGNRGANERAFITWSLLPLTGGAIGLTMYWAMTDVSLTTREAALGGALGGAVTWTVFGLFAGTRRWRPRTSIAATVAGTVAATGLLWLGQSLFGGQETCDRLFAVFSVPLIFGVLTVATFIFIGFASAEAEDSDLEWWSRVGSWVLIVSLAWLVVHGIVFYGPAVLRAVRDALLLLGLDTRGQATGAIGLLTSFLGGVVAYLARGLMTEKRDQSPSRIKALAVGLAAPAFVVLLVASAAWMNEMLLDGLNARLAEWRYIDLDRLSLNQIDACGANYWREVLLLGGGLAAFGVTMGRFVPVNKFSLHGMYRERLIRSFVGASRPDAERRPNPFTGFDAADDLQLAALRDVRPLLAVNMTLNRVAEASRPGGRMAEGFTATPLFVGARSLGYRPTDEYASNARLGRRGLSLGTAMTISGAAASPNMGVHSSPALAFLLTLFNARLGAWLGNPGPGGDASWRRSDPGQGVRPLLREMLGQTGGSGAHVYLSDGGHYENCGLVAMIERRCRYILVSDAGGDEEYAFEDLAAALRLARIDLGIPIEFPDGLPISRERQGKGNPHVVIGRIHYRAVDGPAAEDGTLLYVKATLSGDEPLDVLNYARAHPAFPHESTANQWFSEAQFESYRVLGHHSVMSAARGYQGSGEAPDFFAWMAARAGRAAPTAASDQGARDADRARMESATDW